MADSKKVPNIFILLEIDPDQPWDQAVFEKRIQAKKREWSKWVNKPGEKAEKAKINLDLVPRLIEISQDGAQRRSQANEAKKQRAQTQAAQIREVDDLLELLQAKSFVWEDELAKLIADFQGVLSEPDIRERVAVEVRSAESTTERLTLGTSTAKRIHLALQHLGKADLYDFLDLGRKTETRLLLQRAAEIYSNTSQTARKTAEVTLTATLAGECLVIFKTQEKRERYDETLHVQKFDDLKAKVEQLAQISRQLGPQPMEILLREAREQGLDPEETVQVIQKHAHQHKIAVYIPAETTESIKQLLRCGYCNQLNRAVEKHCTNCGEPLQEPCPECGHVVTSNERACGKCGFPVGNRTYVSTLVSQVRGALPKRDYSIAASALAEAKREWPSDGGDQLGRQIQELEDSVEPAKKKQEDVLGQMRQALKQKHFYDARDILPELREVLPADDGQLADFEQQIDSKIAQAEARLKRARGISSDDPEAVVRLYQEALQACSDCEEARDALARTPPEAPLGLAANLGERLVRLSWKPSASQGVSYTVVRKKKARPVSVKDGTQLATVTGTAFDDAKPDIGVPLFYAVYADREGVPSRDAAGLTQPVMLVQEVKNLMALVDDRQVRLRWEPPPNVDNILVARSETGPPTSPRADGAVSALDKCQAVDTQVHNGRKYYYRVFCQFRDEQGNLTTTQGEAIDAIPQLPPKPIDDWQMSVHGSGGDCQIQLHWQAPSLGDVAILRSRRPIDLAFGAVVPRKGLSKHGDVLPTTSNQFACRIEELGVYYFVPVVLFQKLAYVGHQKDYAHVEDVSELSVQNLGHCLRLQWQWPRDCREAIIAHSQEGWPQPDRRGTTTVSLTRAEYDLRGYYDILNPVQQDHYISVMAVMNHGGQRIVAKGEGDSACKLVSLHSRITLSYEIKQARMSKRLSLRLTLKGKGTLPTLVLVRKQRVLPMNKSDGTVIMRTEASHITSERITIDLPNDARLPQGYAKLFLEDDSLYDRVAIHLPAIGKLKMF